MPMEDQPRKQLGTKIVVAVFALLLVTMVTTTTVHPVYADEDCEDDDECGDGCIVSIGGISICTIAEHPTNPK